MDFVLPFWENLLVIHCLLKKTAEPEQFFISQLMTLCKHEFGPMLGLGDSKVW